MNVKPLLVILFLCTGIASWGQEQKYTNKYDMKLIKNEDGSFELYQREKYEKIIDLTKVEDLLIPYKYKAEKLREDSYSKTKTTTITYKTYPSYSLQGYSGVYDLSTAQILKKKAFKEMANYFKGFDPKVLEAASPIKLINKKTKLAAQLYCGTADLTVEYSQSLDFADALQKKKGCVVDLQVYENYGHTPQGKKSDKMEEIFFKSVDFITKYL